MIHLIYMDGGQIKPVSSSPSKKSLYIITLLLIILIIGIGVVITLFVGRKKEPQVNTQTGTSPAVSVIETENVSTSSSDIKQQDLKLIVYSKDNNIWSVRSDGTQLRQYTRDGDGGTITYPSYMFLGNDILVFIRCVISESSCGVIERNLSTDAQTPGVQIPSLITNFVQSTDNNPVYAYITSGSEASSNLVMKVGDSEVKVIEFAGGLGRGGSFNDEQSLKFSPNNQYLLVVNTSTQPNIDNDKISIWIIDKNGNIVDTIPGEFASNAIWENNNRILYSDSGNLYRRIIGSPSTLVGPLDGYNIDLLDDGKTLLYWNTLDGVTSVYTYDISGNKTQELVGNISSAKWVTSNSIAGRSTTKSTESMFGFELNGLVNYSIPDGQRKILDSNSSIWNFVVSP